MFIQILGIEVRKCRHRYYGNKENIVCVCNATYCDDVPKVGNLKSLQAVIYKTNQRGKRFEYTVSSFGKKTNGDTSLQKFYRGGVEPESFAWELIVRYGSKQ
ncbi:unnamed protein product [Brugia timori]|uniref:Glucosylceramidase n=1 Tax=Brugia timori TaxID=42155 RepID=A0A3P7WF81_9BILA|nr:unnamed protein product [Brugia timori]